MSTLQGRIAMVTGASSGMGRAIALELAARGAKVICTDIKKSARQDGFEIDLTQDTDDLIKLRGGEALFIPVDVSKSADFIHAVDQAVKHFGRLDIMVNNAGVFTSTTTIIDQSEEDYDFTMAINAKGVFLGCKYALTQMMKQPVIAGQMRGRIVNIASVAALSGLHLEPAYCASKGAVTALTRQLAVDFAPHGIGINAILPGFIETGMTRGPLSDENVVKSIRMSNTYPRFGQPKDIAKATAYLVSEDAEYVNGSLLSVDGAFLAF